MGLMSAIYVNRILLACVVGAVALVVCIYYATYNSQTHSSLIMTHHRQQADSWKKGDFVQIPEVIYSKTKTFPVDIKDVNIKVETETLNIAYRESRSKEPSKLNVLFLHGQKFTSQNWDDLGTLQLVAAMGHRAIAVDLPGYEKSRPHKIDSALFMRTLIEDLDIERPVIVSPSMSGRYSLPYIMQSPGDSKRQISGYIPIAPVFTEKYTPRQYNRVDAPTMIVYGSKDTALGIQSLGALRNIPTSEICEIQGAGHAAYLDKPQEFHMLLYNFLRTVQDME